MAPPGAAPPTSNRPAILQVDMDAFYASVEAHDDPSLRAKPLIVGGTGRRGVVASCSYEARAYGVRSAMPSGKARQLCPHAVVVSGRFGRYEQASAQIHEIFHRFTPWVEGIALDEAFLDVTGATRLFGTARAIAAQIRATVGAELGLSCSVGVARVKFLAKLASEAAKPRAALSGTMPGLGVVVVEAGRELEFLHPLPIESLWGVGPVTAARIRRLGLTTVGELASLPVEALEAAVGRAAGRHLHALANGDDPRAVETGRATKSVGHEETYASDVYESETLGREVVRMADAVASRLRSAGVAGRTVNLKIRYSDFATITRSHTVGVAVQAGTEIARAGARMLQQVELSRGVRLLGVSVSNLTAASEAGSDAQLALNLEGVSEAFDLDKLRRDWQAADQALDEVRARYGTTAAGPAVLLSEGGIGVKRRGDTQWGPADGPPPS
ncbi:MAG: DNA polymerase IV [Acidimicrobiales bacterium]